MNLIQCMNSINEFSLFSGLKMNLDKTKLIEIGGDGRTSNVKLRNEFQQNWTKTFTSLGIEFDLDDMLNITELNRKKKISDIKKLIKIWTPRNLTVIGKITIVKSLFVSKFTHILLALPNPSEAIFREIDEIFAKFIWQNIPSKFRKEILVAPYDKSGLQLMDLSFVIA